MDKENLTEIIHLKGLAGTRVCPNACCWSRRRLGQKHRIGGASQSCIFVTKWRCSGMDDPRPCEYHCEKEETPFANLQAMVFASKKLKRFSRKSTLSVRYTLLIKTVHLIPQETSVPVVVTVHDFICILNRFILLVKLLMLESKNRIGSVART